jgi:hypothetical protein
MRVGSALVFLLLACLVSVSPIAYASPPDPTWMAGIYDDDDGDDVIVSLTWAAWAIELEHDAHLPPLFLAVPFDPPSAPRLVSLAVQRAFLGRAPPRD